MSFFLKGITGKHWIAEVCGWVLITVNILKPVYIWKRPHFILFRNSEGWYEQKKNSTPFILWDRIPIKSLNKKTIYSVIQLVLAIKVDNGNPTVSRS